MAVNVRPFSRSDEWRILAGIAIQPFVAGAVAFAAFPVLLLTPDGQALAGGYPSDVTDAAISVALGAAILAGVVALLGALPAAVWLMKRRDLSLARTLGLGLVFGNIPYILLAIVGGTYGLAGLVRGLLFASLLGAAGAASFWFIAVAGRTAESDHLHDALRGRGNRAASHDAAGVARGAGRRGPQP
jgi:hypothetical protein